MFVSSFNRFSSIFFIFFGSCRISFLMCSWSSKSFLYSCLLWTILGTIDFSSFNSFNSSMLCSSFFILASCSSLKSSCCLIIFWSFKYILLYSNLSIFFLHWMTSSIKSCSIFSYLNIWYSLLAFIINFSYSFFIHSIFPCSFKKSFSWQSDIFISKSSFFSWLIGELSAEAIISS